MKKKLWVVSLILFGLSLISPVYSTTEGSSGFGSGFGMLLLGWLFAFFEGGVAVAWFANPFYIIALCTTKKYPVASMVFAVISIPIALVFLKGGEVWLNEAGNKAYINKIQIGYWFWLGSMAVILFASGFELIDRQKKKITKL